MHPWHLVASQDLIQHVLGRCAASWTNEEPATAKPGGGDFSRSATWIEIPKSYKIITAPRKKYIHTPTISIYINIYTYSKYIICISTRLLLQRFGTLVMLKYRWRLGFPFKMIDISLMHAMTHIKEYITYMTSHFRTSPKYSQHLPCWYCSSKWYWSKGNGNCQAFDDLCVCFHCPNCVISSLKQTWEVVPIEQVVFQAAKLFF